MDNVMTYSFKLIFLETTSRQLDVIVTYLADVVNVTAE